MSLIPIEVSDFLDKICRKDPPTLPISKSECIIQLQAYFANKISYGPKGPVDSQLEAIFASSEKDCYAFINSIRSNYTPEEVAGILLGTVGNFSKVRFCKDVILSSLIKSFGSLPIPASTITSSTPLSSRIPPPYIVSTSILTTLPSPFIPKISKVFEGDEKSRYVPPLYPVKFGDMKPPYKPNLNSFVQNPSVLHTLHHSFSTPSVTHQSFNSIPIPSLMHSSSGSNIIGRAEKATLAPPLLPVLPMLVVQEQKKTCDEFSVNFVCKHICSGYHPSSLIICRALLAGSACSKANSGCRFQHLNETAVFVAIQQAAQVLAMPIDEFQKVCSRYIMGCSQMSTEICSNDPDCDDPHCTKQHPVFIKPPAFVALTAKYASQTYSIQDVTSDVAQMEIARNVLRRSTTMVIKIVKLEKITTPTVAQKYANYLAAYQKKTKEYPNQELFCHGTCDSATIAISKDGFLTSSIRRTLYGPGHYFAHNPEIAVGFANPKDKVMLLCNIPHSAINYVASMKYFVVPDDDAILPVYILHFTT